MPAADGDQGGWYDEILGLIRSAWRDDQLFSLADVYGRAGPVLAKHPENQHPESKIRQILQLLRDAGEITFVDNEGHYAPNRLLLPPGDPLGRVPDPVFRAQLLRIRNLLGQTVASRDLQAQVKGFASQKGIYKPAGSKYALWVRQTSKGVYPDWEPTYRPDGSWQYRYSPEGRGGRADPGLDTNQSLLRCQRDRVPIGVFRQVSDTAGQAAYEVLGLAMVEGFDGEHFLLRGEPIDVAEPPMVGSLTPSFRPFESIPSSLTMVARIVRDQRFGVAVRRVYHGRCSLCNIGFRIGAQPVGLDAAHIIPVEERGNLGDLRNGILLCKNHHALFDRLAWTMDEDLIVHVAPDGDLRASALENHVLSLEGRKLPNLPFEHEDYPAAEALRWRVERFNAAWS